MFIKLISLLFVVHLVACSQAGSLGLFKDGESQTTGTEGSDVVDLPTESFILQGDSGTDGEDGFKGMDGDYQSIYKDTDEDGMSDLLESIANTGFHDPKDFPQDSNRDGVIDLFQGENGEPGQDGVDLIPESEFVPGKNDPGEPLFKEGTYDDAACLKAIEDGYAALVLSDLNKANYQYYSAVKGGCKKDDLIFGASLTSLLLLFEAEEVRHLFKVADEFPFLISEDIFGKNGYFGGLKAVQSGEAQISYSVGGIKSANSSWSKIISYFPEINKGDLSIEAYSDNSEVIATFRIKDLAISDLVTGEPQTLQSERITFQLKDPVKEYNFFNDKNLLFAKNLTLGTAENEKIDFKTEDLNNDNFKDLLITEKTAEGVYNLLLYEGLGVNKFSYYETYNLQEITGTDLINIPQGGTQALDINKDNCQDFIFTDVSDYFLKRIRFFIAYGDCSGYLFTGETPFSVSQKVKLSGQISRTEFEVLTNNPFNKVSLSISGENLVFAISDNVYLINVGVDGSLQAPTLLATPEDYKGLANFLLADFNKDNREDFIFLNRDNFLAIALGNENGTFQLSEKGCLKGDILLAGDFNGDGTIDLLVDRKYLDIEASYDQIISASVNFDITGVVCRESNEVLPPLPPFLGNGYLVADFNDDDRDDLILLDANSDFSLLNGHSLVLNRFEIVKLSKLGEGGELQINFNLYGFDKAGKVVTFKGELSDTISSLSGNYAKIPFIKEKELLKRIATAFSDNHFDLKKLKQTLMNFSENVSLVTELFKRNSIDPGFFFKLPKDFFFGRSDIIFNLADIYFINGVLNFFLFLNQVVDNYQVDIDFDLLKTRDLNSFVLKLNREFLVKNRTKNLSEAKKYFKDSLLYFEKVVNLLLTSEALKPGIINIETFSSPGITAQSASDLFEFITKLEKSVLEGEVEFTVFDRERTINLKKFFDSPPSSEGLDIDPFIIDEEGKIQVAELFFKEFFRDILEFDFSFAVKAAQKEELKTSYENIRMKFLENVNYK